jgi:hypothetical protein
MFIAHDIIEDHSKPQRGGIVMPGRGHVAPLGLGRTVKAAVAIDMPLLWS